MHSPSASGCIVFYSFPFARTTQVTITKTGENVNPELRTELMEVLRVIADEQANVPPVAKIVVAVERGSQAEHLHFQCVVSSKDERTQNVGSLLRTRFAQQHGYSVRLYSPHCPAAGSLCFSTRR